MPQPPVDKPRTGSPLDGRPAPRLAASLILPPHARRHADPSDTAGSSHQGPDGRPIAVTPVVSALHKNGTSPTEAPAICERCGAEMYRMHAVWRCPQCRFKTDCCGW